MASDDQLIFINNIRMLGGVAFFADSLMIVKKEMDDLKKANR